MGASEDEGPLPEMDAVWDDLYSAEETAEEVLDVDITVSYDRGDDPEDYVQATRDLVDQVTEAYKRRDELDRQMGDELGNRLGSLLSSARGVAAQARLGAEAADDLNWIKDQLEGMELDDRTRTLIGINDDIYSVGQDHGVYADDE
jgi:hypothetical protein